MTGFPQKTLCLDFFTDKNLRADETILDITREVISLGEPFIPEKCNLGKITKRRYRKFKGAESLENLRKAIPSYDFDDRSLGFLSEDKYYFYLNFSRRVGDEETGIPDPNVISLELDGKYFNDKDFCDRFLELSKKIYHLCSPYIGEAHDLDDADKFFDDKRRLEYYGTPRFYVFYWANFLSPEGVEIYGGREKVLKAPCYRVEELSDGGVLLVLAPTPVNPESKEFREAQNKLLAYFDMPLITEEYLKTLEARS